jgi:hypothetical protein
MGSHHTSCCSTRCTHTLLSTLTHTQTHCPYAAVHLTLAATAAVTAAVLGLSTAATAMRYMLWLKQYVCLCLAAQSAVFSVVSVQFSRKFTLLQITTTYY